MATEHNNWIFFTLNVGYRFGRIIDISEAARSKSRKEKKAERKAAKAASSNTAY
jgi:hypothetical protein